MSLEELKRQNELEETGQVEESQTETEIEEESAEKAQEENTSEEGSEGAEESSDDTVEAWMQGEEQTSQDSETVPLGAHVKLKHKLKDKVYERDEEIQKLRNEIESLKSKSAAPAAATGRPRREDFDELDDPEGSYEDALYSWRRNQETEKTNANAVADRQKRLQEERDTKLQSHYQRVETLLAENSIDSSVYDRAEDNLIQALEAVQPNHGSIAAQVMVAQIGDGSEKLVLYIGNNPERRSQLSSAFASDPSGLGAMRLLGKFEAEMDRPQKRVSKAPSPAKRANGDESSSSANGLHRKFKAATSSGDAQKAFDIRREARKQKIDVSTW